MPLPPVPAREVIQMPFTPQTAAEALLARLHANGLDALFANGGTDFASIIEAYARGGPVGPSFQNL